MHVSLDTRETAAVETRVAARLRRTDEGLPLAGGARVAGERAVGEQTQLSVEGRLDLADVGAVAGEQGALQERLQHKSKSCMSASPSY